MNFVDIIEKFNFNKNDNFYEIINNNKILQIMPSYVHENFIILTLKYDKIIIVNINDLEELILAFLNDNISQIYSYEKYYIMTQTEFNFCLLSKYTNDRCFLLNVDMEHLFFNDSILIERNNGFFKLLNTNTYIFTSFKYIFDPKNWDIVSLYNKLDNYLHNKYKYALMFKNYKNEIILKNDPYYLPYINFSSPIINNELTPFNGLYVHINFTKKQFNNIVSRLKNETIFDILNINRFRRSK